MDTLSYTLDLCAKAQVPVMLDPAPAAALPDAVSTQVAWFTPNETEAAFYVGDGTERRGHGEALACERAARRRAEARRRGRICGRCGRKAEWVKPFKVDAIDTVGAGDCFNGAFAVALLEGKDPWAAARFANAASAICVTRNGAQASMPSRAEVDEFLAKHGA